MPFVGRLVASGRGPSALVIFYMECVQTECSDCWTSRTSYVLRHISVHLHSHDRSMAGYTTRYQGMQVAIFASLDC